MKTPILVILAMLSALLFATTTAAQTGPSPVQDVLQEHRALLEKSSRKTIGPAIDAIALSGLPQMQGVLEAWRAKDVWQRLDDPETLVWMLAYRDRAHRTEVWNKFREDPAWDALLSKYPVGVSAEVYMMSATDYSKLK